jgi:hypothetical protein
VEDIVGAGVDGQLRLLDGSIGTIVWTSPFIGMGLKEIQTGDFDADGVPEILASTWIGVLRFQGPLLELFLSGFESGDLAGWSDANP